MGTALEPLGLVAPLPWFLLAASSPRVRFVHAWLGAAAFVAAGLWWLNHVHPVATLLCALHFGLYPALGAWALSRLRGAAWPLVLAAPACVFAYETLLQRACLLETSWLSFGTLAWRAPGLAQLAAFGGTPLISALICAVPAGMADAVLAVRAGGREAARRPRTWAPLLGAIAALVIGGLVGQATMPSRESIRPLLSVALVQGNIPQDARNITGNAGDIVRKHAEMTLGGVPPGTGLVAWPESTASLALEREPAVRAFLGDVVARTGAPLLLGATGLNEGGPPSNSAFLVERGGVIAGRSDKRYLVPGAETLLLLDHIPAIRDPLGDLLARTMHFRPYLLHGDKPIVLQASGVRFGVLICYDDIVADPSDELRAAGAEALVTITNEAWFGRGELRQHLAMAVFRCIETRLPMARAGNDGMTCTIGPAGRVTAILPAGQEGVLTGDLFATSQAPVPAWVRAIVAWCGVAVTAMALGLALRRQAAQDAPVVA